MRAIPAIVWYGIGTWIGALSLDGILTLGGRPADVEAIDADPVVPMRVRHIARQSREPALGRHVGGKDPASGVGRDGDDVHDGARGVAGLQKLASQ